MTRVGKYMVYNPRKEKPVKYYDKFEQALADADLLNLKEESDILVLKVVANIENDIFKLHSSEDRTNQRLLMRIED